jgi:malate synthase
MSTTGSPAALQPRRHRDRHCAGAHFRGRGRKVPGVDMTQSGRFAGAREPGEHESEPETDAIGGEVRCAGVARLSVLPCHVALRLAVMTPSTPPVTPLAAHAGVEITAALPPELEGVLTPAALAFVVDLHRRFDPRRRELLARREAVQEQLASGWLPDFLPETIAVRHNEWRVAPMPDDLRDRRVEITGPVDRKMIINALNSGANVFMADFEDSCAPSWQNVLDGQRNLADAVRRTITFTDGQKHYALTDRPAVLFVRPRGWHLVEKHVQIDGRPCSASLFDFGLFVFHNAKEQLARGTAPYFYLPKMESHLEARLWNEVFVHAQQALGIPTGTIKATVLIETILAAFEMDEILYELREHSAGLNCGRWDYIFSFIKKFAHDPARVMPDRATVTMEQHFLRSYSRLLIETCHRRSAHAMGGMAAQIPIKHDAEANERALAKVRADKRREAYDGHDGTWVAHPGLVAIAREQFDAVLGDKNNQLQVRRPRLRITQHDLLQVPTGPITETGLRQNLGVGVRYLEAWLRGSGCVPIHHLMEDAATAEISRTQVWQWRHHGVRLDDGRVVDDTLIQLTLAGELAKIRDELGAERFAQSRFLDASRLFESLILADQLPEWLTVPAYEQL